MSQTWQGTWPIINWHQTLHVLSTLKPSIGKLASGALTETHSCQGSVFPICLEELSTNSLEIISCLLSAWMSLHHDLAGWSLFLVLQDHDGIDYGTSSFAQSSAQSPSTVLLAPFAHFTFTQNQRASCTTTSVPSSRISTMKSCS